MFPDGVSIESDMIVRHDPKGGLLYHVDSLRLDTDDYESVHALNGLRRVTYTQLEDGDYPAGTEYDKSEEQFRANFTPIIEVEGEILERGPELVVGWPLVGHTPWNVMAEQEDGDKKYWAQVIPSEFGDLYYALEQYRDGTERWVTNHGEVQVVTSLGVDEPAVVREIQTQPLHKSDDAEIYETGIREYREAHPED